MAECPECNAGIETKGMEKGEITTCRDCGAELEVVSEGRLEPAPEVKEDWGE